MSTVDKAKDIVGRILTLMNFSATIEGEESEEAVTIIVRSQDDPNIIIGKQGKNLDALQYIVNRIIHKDDKEGKRVVLDSEGYREKRKTSLESMARQTAEIVRTTGKAIALEDLTARDRWIVHNALKTEQGVRTESRGDGPTRKLIILPDQEEK